MNWLLTVLEMIFVILGVATMLRYLVWKFTSDPACDSHILVLLRDGCAEWSLRSTLEKNKHDIDTRSCLVYAVDMGLSSEEAHICEMFSLRHPQVIYCKPEELSELLLT